MNDAALDALLARLAARAARAEAAADLPQAAVALLLAPAPTRLLLIRRAERTGDPWSGQLALPGGRRDPRDADLLATALRETREEVGLAVPRAAHAATLDDLAPRIAVLPPIVVRPFVLRAVADGPLVHAVREVASAHWVPLDRLADPANRAVVRLEARGAPREVEGHQLAEGFLWGMTERILAPVVAAWREIAGPAGNPVPSLRI